MEGLTLAALYCIGEFGQLLVKPPSFKLVNNNVLKVTEEDVVSFVNKIFKKIGTSRTVKEYGLTALIKLYTKFKS